MRCGWILQCECENRLGLGVEFWIYLQYPLKAKTTCESRTGRGKGQMGSLRAAELFRHHEKGLAAVLESSFPKLKKI